jgi:hypothetical protein
MGTLIVLNDGTDEIFNIHAYDIKCRSQLFWDLVTTFWTCPAAKDFLEENLHKDGDWYSNWVELLVKDKLENSYFIITHEEPSEVDKKVETQNFDCVELYKEEEFKDWNEVVPELNQLTNEDWSIGVS